MAGRLSQTLAVVGYLIAGCALTTPLYESLPPLSPEGLGVIAVGVHLALGLSLRRRWATLLPGAPLAVAVFVLSDAALAIVAVPFAVVIAAMGAALVGAGVAVRRALSRRRPGTEWWVARAATVTVSLCWIPVLSAAVVAVRPIDVSPEKPRVVDETRGSYRGVRLGDRPRRVRATLGEPPARGGGAPRGEDFYEIGGPTSSQPPPRIGPITAYRYRGLLLEMTSQGVYAFTITDGDAETGRGVGIGDSLGTVRRAYPGLECGTANEGSEYVTFPYCGERLTPGRYVWFGQDPIRSITVAVTPLG